MTPLAERIDALLPQTQCTRCGYPACQPYAEAVATGRADFNRCPPGGDAVLHGIAALLGAAPKPLADDVGHAPPQLALIDEQRCIGCTKCIQACPLDAIIGAAKLMHSVIAAECSGCELCLPPCPVDCIELLAAAPWTTAQAARGRQRYRQRQRRLEKQAATRRRTDRPADTDKNDPGLVPHDPTRLSRDAKRAVVAAAVARAKARRQARGSAG